MKIKNKGKVHPSPSSSSFSFSFASSSSGTGTGTGTVTGERDVLSVLRLLPAAILALVSVLSLEDREVLAYMIAWYMKNSLNPPSLLNRESKKRPAARKPPIPNHVQKNSANANHKSPAFDCDCFDCYTSYWCKWDSSSNRELIHQVIEAFEDRLTNGENSKKAARGKRRDKSGRRMSDKSVSDDVPGQPEKMELETPTADADKSPFVAVVSPDDDVFPVMTREKAADGEEGEKAKVEEEEEMEEELEKAVVGRTPASTIGSSHKGLARKVLPDVLGLLNSRLWNLWGPNV